MSFSKSGPRNQGRITAMRPSQGTSSISKPNVFPSSPPKTRETQDTMRLPGYQTSKATSELINERLPQRSKPLSGSVGPAQTEEGKEERDGGFVHIDDLEIQDVNAGLPSRRASQRSVRITEDGSPVPEGAMNQSLLSTSSEADGYTKVFGQNGSRSPNSHGKNQELIYENTGRSSEKTLSSNSKPLPQSPWVESQVISGYAPERVIQQVVEQAKRLARDPFHHKDKPVDNAQSEFLQRLAKNMSTAHTQHVDGSRNGLEMAATPNLGPNIAMDASSSDEDEKVQLIAEAEPSTEDLEWEAALQPRHRNMLDILGRIARRLVIHMLENETPHLEIVDEYSRDGRYILDQMEEMQTQQLESWFGSFKKDTCLLYQQYAKVERKLQDRQTEIRSQVRLELTKWKQDQDASRRQIEQLEALALLK